MVVCVLALRHTGDLSRVDPASHPKTAGIGSSTPTTLKRIRDGGMNAYKNKSLMANQWVREGLG